MKRILVIGDPHAHPDYDNERFRAAGRFAARIEADRVHCVGDWTDWPSLNRHKIRTCVDSIERDAEAGNEALSLFQEGLDGWDPELTISLGNHDMYPDRYVSDVDPAFKGLLRWDLVDFRAYGWKTCRYKKVLKRDGFLHSHHFPTGISGRPQGGVHVAHQNLTKQGDSVVFGHNHLFDVKVRTFHSRKVWGFSAGCFVHPKYIEDWCRDTRHLWDLGLLVLEVDRGKLLSFKWETDIG